MERWVCLSPLFPKTQKAGELHMGTGVESLQIPRREHTMAVDTGGWFFDLLFTASSNPTRSCIIYNTARWHEDGTAWLSMGSTGFQTSRTEHDDNCFSALPGGPSRPAFWLSCQWKRHYFSIVFLHQQTNVFYMLLLLSWFNSMACISACES